MLLTLYALILAMVTLSQFSALVGSNPISCATSRKNVRRFSWFVQQPEGRAVLSAKEIDISCQHSSTANYKLTLSIHANECFLQCLIYSFVFIENAFTLLLCVWLRIGQGRNNSRMNSYPFLTQLIFGDFLPIFRLVRIKSHLLSKFTKEFTSPFHIGPIAFRINIFLRLPKRPSYYIKRITNQLKAFDC